MPVTESYVVLATVERASGPRAGEYKPHLRSPPGIVGLCRLTEVTPCLLYVQDVVLEVA